jgi:hypothetical protein
MNPEELMKILANEEIKAEDKAKLIQELYDATARGLTLKNEELIGADKKLKEKLESLEQSAAKSGEQIKALEEQVKKNNPEEAKKYYEGITQELQTKHQDELKVISEERDRFKQSHYTRLQDDAVLAGVKDLQFLDGLRDGFVALAMSKNQFLPREIDGKTIFTNKDNKTIEAVLHEFSLSNEGKAYLKDTNSGGGSSSHVQGPGNLGAPKPGQSLTRDQFSTLNDQKKMEFINQGGQILDSPK